MRTALIYLTSGKVVHMDVSDWECDGEWEYLEEMKSRLLELRYLRSDDTIIATKHIEAVKFVDEQKAGWENAPLRIAATRTLNVDGRSVADAVIKDIDRRLTVMSEVWT